MTKLYYTDPLKAAYMAREFGVEMCAAVKDELCGYIYSYNYGGDWLSIILDSKGIRDSAWAKPENFHVLPEFHHIFEPQQGDIDSFGAEYSRGVWFYGDYEQVYDYAKIIMRNGKHFFMPEVEACDGD